MDTGVLSLKVKDAAIFGPKTEASGCWGAWENPTVAPANKSAAESKFDFMSPSLFQF